MPANLPPLSLFQLQTFGGSYVGASVTRSTPDLCFRQGRACPGHLRLAGTREGKDVDARDKPGHDEVRYGIRIRDFRMTPPFSAIASRIPSQTLYSPSPRRRC